jgi:hypothetical protein
LSHITFSIKIGWNGVLIEANHEIYPSLVRNRPHTHRLHFAPSCPNEPESPTTVSFYSGHHTMSGLTSVLPLEKSRTHKVPCGGLTPVLSELLQGHVTLFSLDVEGAEPLVLRHLNWSSSSLLLKQSRWKVEALAVRENPSNMRHERRFGSCSKHNRAIDDTLVLCTSPICTFILTPVLCFWMILNPWAGQYSSNKSRVSIVRRVNV